ncbi:desmethyl-deoxy-podophyllotoxin synthase-like [Curcuma longa]|uniref:desmethyl-deoxy-podophyllotoxin synthase-like n=1 Tax=Curcuma longa TaxID=136217 RepID=UPI003D9EB5BF
MAMDLSITSFLFSSFLLLLLILLLKLGSRQRGGSRLPPGPRPLPVIGSMHLVGELPQKSMASLAKQYGPVMHLKLGEISTVVVSSPEAAAEVTKTRDAVFANRPATLAYKILSFGGKGVLFTPYGANSRELRKMSTMSLLSAKQVRFFRSIREQETLNMLSSVASEASGSIVNLSAQILRLTNDITARALIGAKCRYQKEFLALVDESIEEMSGFSLVDSFPSWAGIIGPLNGVRRKLKRLLAQIDLIIGSILDEHREAWELSGEKEEKDMIDVMLRIQHEESLPFPLTNEYIIAIAMDLFVAGSDTSSTTLQWIMSELIRNPSVMKRVQQEVREAFGGDGKPAEENVGKLSYLKLVIKETLRLHPPAPFLVRVCLEPTELLGHQIPANTRVLVNAWAIARDPAVWGDDAEEFRPERFEGSAVDYKGTHFELLPFGSGRRMCAGMGFGVATVEFPLACLLYYFDWKLPENEIELDMREQFKLTSRRKTDLRLRAVPRLPLP